MFSRGTRLLTAACAAALALLLGAGEGLAERAWVKDEVRLNVRTGAGVGYRIRGGIATGDAVEILSRGDGWTQVRAAGGLEGWIPEGYLQPEPPASIRLARFEAETADLRERYAALSQEVEELRERTSELDATRRAQEEEIARLSRENLDLRAGARWPEWIAGASILFVGALLGMIVHRSASRRPGSRIRL